MLCLERRQGCENRFLCLPVVKLYLLFSFGEVFLNKPMLGFTCPVFFFNNVFSLDYAANY